MEKHDSEWFRQRAIEKRHRDQIRKNYHQNKCKRDLEELEVEFSQSKKPKK